MSVLGAYIKAQYNRHLRHKTLVQLDPKCEHCWDLIRRNFCLSAAKKWRIMEPGMMQAIGNWNVLMKLGAFYGSALYGYQWPGRTVAVHLGREIRL